MDKHGIPINRKEAGSLTYCYAGYFDNLHAKSFHISITYGLHALLYCYLSWYASSPKISIGCKHEVTGIEADAKILGAKRSLVLFDLLSKQLMFRRLGIKYHFCNSIIMADEV